MTCKFKKRYEIPHFPNYAVIYGDYPSFPENWYENWSNTVAEEAEKDITAPKEELLPEYKPDEI